MDRQTFSPGPLGGEGQDYILRQIEDFAVFLGKLVGLIQRREISVAMKRIESFYRESLPVDAGLIHTLSDRALIELLRKDGALDPIKSVNLARILVLDADLAAGPDAGRDPSAPIARVKYLLAFSLLMEVDLGAGLPGHAEPDLAALAARIEDWDLPPGPAYKLFRYMERQGRFGKAEDALFRLKDSGYPDAAREGRLFYRRLAALGDEELSKGNLPRSELEEGRRHFQDADGEIFEG